MDLPLEFKEMPLRPGIQSNSERKKFDSILGKNIWKSSKAVIKMDSDTIAINNNTIKFLFSCPYVYKEMYILGTSSTK